MEYCSVDAKFLNVFVIKAKLERGISIGNAENGYLAPKESFCGLGEGRGPSITQRVGQGTEGPN